MPSKIEDYAMLGDCETSALVARNGSVDWLCWPRFDSNACFAALLGDPKNGRWLIAPMRPLGEAARRYRENTLILETEIETAEGAATLIEFMPPRRSVSDLVRIVVGKRGQVAMRTELIIRFDYGSLVPWVTTREDGTLCAISGPDMVVLRTPIPLRGEDRKTVGEFTVSAGETVPFVLTYRQSHLENSCPNRSHRDSCRYRSVLDRVVEPVSRRRGMVGAGNSLAHHPEGSHLSTHGRNRGRAYDVSTGTARWAA